jgi:hypothetical protein
MSAAAGWSGSIREALDQPLQRLRMGYAAWLFGVFCYFLPAATWNPVSRFDLTRAIIEQGTFSIDAYADNTGDRARRAEHWYTDKAPVSSLLALPAYQAFHWLDLGTGGRRYRTRALRALAAPHVPDRSARGFGRHRAGNADLSVCNELLRTRGGRRLLGRGAGVARRVGGVRRRRPREAVEPASLLDRRGRCMPGCERRL